MFDFIDPVEGVQNEHFMVRQDHVEGEENATPMNELNALS